MASVSCPDSATDEEMGATSSAREVTTTDETELESRSAVEDQLHDEIDASVADPLRVGRVKKSKRWFRYTCCVVSIILLLIFILVVWSEVERARRASMLYPLIDKVQHASSCRVSGQDACRLLFNANVQDEFDLHPAENALFGFLFQQVMNRSTDDLKEVFCGAHVTLAQDADSQLYDFLTTLPGAYKRISSHKSDRKQFGVPEGRIVRTLLVGKVKESTWLQLEGNEWHPFQEPVDSFGHIMDFVRYRLYGENVGPLGMSPYTEKKPLRYSEVIPEPSKVCPTACNAIQARPEHTVMM